MQTHFERELEHLKRRFHEQMARVENNARAVLTLPIDSHGGGLGATYIEDKTLDKHEVEIEEDCLKIIALHQPVADHLRFLITVIKANSDLERTGDLLEDIRGCEVHPAGLDRALGLEEGETQKLFLLVLRAVEEALGCLQSHDAERARQLWRDDKAIDEQVRRLVASVYAFCAANPAPAEVLQGLRAIRAAERIADIAAKVAKEILYLATGEIVRHRKRQILGEG